VNEHFFAGWAGGLLCHTKINYRKMHLLAVDAWGPGNKGIIFPLQISTASLYSLHYLD
jgi:hypothetical protein